MIWIKVMIKSIMSLLKVFSFKFIAFWLLKFCQCFVKRLQPLYISNDFYAPGLNDQGHIGFVLSVFIRPSSDGTYYGMVMSVRPGLRPSVRPSVCPSQFSALFSYMLWHIDLKFCVSLYFYARKIKFECHQFPSLFAGVMLLFNFKLLQICSFPHFSPTCFDILSSNFVYDFVLMYHRASLSVVHLRQFLWELCPFWSLEYSKYTVFRTFLLHSFTYWAEILCITLFLCT